MRITSAGHAAKRVSIPPSPDGAEDVCDRLAPQRADYHYARGTVALDRGKRRGAEKAYRRALDRDNEHLPSLYALARLLSDQGRAKKARPFWQRYLELDPDR